MMKNRLAWIGTAVVVVSGIAFTIDNYWYVYKHPLSMTTNATGSASSDTKSRRTPDMPQDSQHAAAYKELEDRLKAIRQPQKNADASAY